ncbi:uncharacterized protein B0I36DRAFT_391253 [Microdochium trichocladiopsis]|uniref:Uncharacterized protein n=1 Tax=Microdochium trichocladiopsis TaxID=1682393 RepID=A0A9P8YHC0_9PEZI|nr:uncharacterized protein B0I36DRAFT_391253 [Microdochium trichocladiopsis]KAH7040399.1 hypothetical protein B0I36DRAFT_391253 [Microdochium trichocladiopsis]
MEEPDEPGEPCLASSAQPNWIMHHFGADARFSEHQDNKAEPSDWPHSPSPSSLVQPAGVGESDNASDTCHAEDARSSSMLAEQWPEAEGSLADKLECDSQCSSSVISISRSLSTNYEVENDGMPEPSTLGRAQLDCPVSVRSRDKPEHREARQRSRSASSVLDFTQEGLGGRKPHGFKIYNDALPAVQQPQTPQSLPEARHRSRIHDSAITPGIRRIQVKETHLATGVSVARRRGSSSTS